MTYNSKPPSIGSSISYNLEDLYDPSSSFLSSSPSSTSISQSPPKRGKPDAIKSRSGMLIFSGHTFLTQKASDEGNSTKVHVISIPYPSAYANANADLDSYVKVVNSVCECDFSNFLYKTVLDDDGHDERFECEDDDKGYLVTLLIPAHQSLTTQITKTPTRAKQIAAVIVASVKPKYANTIRTPSPTRPKPKPSKRPTIHKYTQPLHPPQTLVTLAPQKTISEKKQFIRSGNEKIAKYKREVSSFFGLGAGVDSVLTRNILSVSKLKLTSASSSNDSKSNAMLSNGGLSGGLSGSGSGVYESCSKVIDKARYEDEGGSVIDTVNNSNSGEKKTEEKVEVEDDEGIDDWFTLGGGGV